MEKDSQKRGPSGATSEMYKNYLIELLPAQAYKIKGQEIKLVPGVPLDEVLEGVKEHFEEVQKARGKKYEFTDLYGKEGAEKQSGLRFTQVDKGLIIDIEFVSYQPTHSGKQKKSKQPRLPEISLRFTLRKGLLFKLYKFIIALESLLKDRQLTYYK